LRLQFQPNSLNPVSLKVENISNWYALRNTLTIHEGPSPLHPNGRQIENRQWFIFVVFAHLVAIKQIQIDGHGATLPTVEVKDRSARHAVIVVSDDLGAVTFEIKAEV
jgi:hypothetical protein